MSDDTPAGPEMDARVAVEVMDVCIHPAEQQIYADNLMAFRCLGCHGDPYKHLVPPYSTNIRATMLVVERMREQGWMWSIFDRAVGWSVTLLHRDHDGLVSNLDVGLVGQPSLPEAICTVALKAVAEVREKEKEATDAH